MQLKDKFGNRITLYQARNGAIMLQFGDSALELTREQSEQLANPYDIEDFDLTSYQQHYN